MAMELNREELIRRGLNPAEAETLVRRVRAMESDRVRVWQWISKEFLTTEHPFSIHRYLHAKVFADRDPADGPAPAWFPEDPGSSNIARLMRRTGRSTYEDLYEWSIRDRAGFWSTVIEMLDIRFQRPFSSVLDTSRGPEHPQWLVGARLNIVESCFRAPDDSPAVVYQAEDGPLRTMSVGELRDLAARVAHGLADLGLGPGDRVAVDMPMTVESVAIFLGAVAAGCAVVTIADSFAPREIAVRLRIGEAKCVFTQDFVLRAGRKLPLYERVKAAGAPAAVVLSCEGGSPSDLREGDLAWDDFLSDDVRLEVAGADPSAYTTILFSSGTTGEPKAIPWDQTTPLKSVVDAFLHHDIRPGDVVCWPTNLGWMMGPWLVYASLVNRATMALYYGTPTTRGFGKFVEAAGVTMLGLVPSLVSAWKSRECLAGLDWSRIRVFSSTGECSNPTDMLYLMSRAGYKPVIEYCGGTEIGGGYITGTVVQPAAPGTFSTPALGSEFVILDEQGRPADVGEVFLVPPSMGMSRELLNRDHHEVYYAGTPKEPRGRTLRRHGDRIQRFSNGYFRVHGRVDDAMNLGGIKVSSLQIEEAVSGVAGIRETAAVSVAPPEGGPGRLILFAVLDEGADADAGALKAEMQQAIRARLNPLFKVHDVVIVDSLPRTASNKVMRRSLREMYRRREAGA